MQDNKVQGTLDYTSLKNQIVRHITEDETIASKTIRSRKHRGLQEQGEEAVASRSITPTKAAMSASSTSSSSSVSGVAVLLLQLLSILQTPLQTNGNILSNKVVPICEAGCHCFGSEGNCPSYPTITDNMLATYRALDHANPMNIQCDPFQSLSCVSGLRQGEACVVDLVTPDTTTESSCPNNHSYRLRTVESLEDAIATKQYITHTGACGACSSLQDLAIMIEYPEIPYRAQQCFFRSNALKYIDEAITCYEEIGFTTTCSAALSYHQKRIVDEKCGYQCAAWGYDGDLGRPSCDDVSGCGACVDGKSISARLELVAGRTFANSGYPSQKAQQCANITSVDIIGGSDICVEAFQAIPPTEVPLDTTPPAIAPVVPTPVVTTDPTQAQIGSGEPTRSPTAPTTLAPVEATAPPVSLITRLPTPPPIPSLSYQKCLSTAAIEVRVGALSGGSGVVCDCSEAELGGTERPRCYSSPDRGDSNQCGILYDPCGNGPECCGNGVRTCRGGSCRPAARTANKDSKRLSGTRGGAARNDRRAPIAPAGGARSRRGRVRGRV